MPIMAIVTSLFSFFGVQTLPAATIWLKIGDVDVRCYKQRVGNDLLIQDPEIVALINDKPVRDVRTIAQCHWEQIGTGETLTAETKLKDAQGNEIPQAKALCILEHTNNKVLNEHAEPADKKQLIFHIMNQDGSIGDAIAPFPPTDKLEILPEGQMPAAGEMAGYMIDATMLESFLVHEEYELPAADPRNDQKLFSEAEKMLKADKIGITTYSNGGFSQYYAFIVPVLREGQFVWVLKISTKKVKYNCLRDVPSKTGIPFKAAKTLETLPPIAALLTVPSRKK